MKIIVVNITRIPALLIVMPLLSASVATSQRLPAQVTVYPEIKCTGFLYMTAEYRVTVQGQPVPVRDYRPFETIDPVRDYRYVHIGLSGGSVTIEVDAKEAITNWCVSPKAYNLKALVKGNKLSFALDRPRYLGIKINDKRMLYFLADPAETDRPDASGVDKATGKRVFNIVASPYEADQTGAHLATASLQKAIDDAAKLPKGGIVYCPAGVYMANGLRMKSNVWLYLEPGAVLMADSNRGNWRKEARGMKPDDMIDCSNTTGVKCYGRGVIYVQGVALQRQKLEGVTPLRLKPFRLENVKEFTLEGLLLNESTAWTVTVEGGSRVAIKNVKVLNEKRSGTNDGIDICGGTDVEVRHCFVACMDDAVCLKGIFHGPVQNVRISDVVIDNRIVGVKVGMQGAQPVRNAHVSDVHIINCHKGIDLMHDYGKAEYRDIVFENITIEQAHGGEPVRAIIRFNQKPGWPRGVGPISDITFRNIHIGESNKPLLLQGYDATNSVKNITLSDIYIKEKRLLKPDESLRIGPFVSGVTLQGKPIPLP
jgi:hypothetical protein